MRLRVHPSPLAETAAGSQAGLLPELAASARPFRAASRAYAGPLSKLREAVSRRRAISLRTNPGDARKPLVTHHASHFGENQAKAFE